MIAPCNRIRRDERRMNTATASAAAPRSYRDVWLISAGHGLTHWYTATFYLLLPLIGKELGLSYTEIGLIMTVQSAAGAIANVPGGMLVDTVGKKERTIRQTVEYLVDAGLIAVYHRNRFGETHRSSMYLVLFPDRSPTDDDCRQYAAVRCR